MRSSAPDEDSAGASFAGLHESLVNVRGPEAACEYGLPCVTRIKDATRIMRSGDRVTVDGYLGIVVIDRSHYDPAGGMPFPRFYRQKKEKS